MQYGKAWHARCYVAFVPTALAFAAAAARMLCVVAYVAAIVCGVAHTNMANPTPAPTPAPATAPAKGKGTPAPAAGTLPQAPTYAAGRVLQCTYGTTCTVALPGANGATLPLAFVVPAAWGHGPVPVQCGKVGALWLGTNPGGTPLQLHVCTGPNGAVAVVRHPGTGAVRVHAYTANGTPQAGGSAVTAQGM
jgi:hypothetical protein